MNELDDNITVERLDFNYKNGSKGWFVRGYNNAKQEYLMIDSFFEKNFPRWIEDVEVPLVEGKGIPTALYMEIHLFKKLRVNPNILRKITILNVHELETIFQLHRLKRINEKTYLDLFFRHTKLFKSRENLLIQTQMKISEIRIDAENALFNHPKHLVDKILGATEKDIDFLCEKYSVTQDEMLFWNFSVELILE
jgi:hypothetical protein